MMAGEPDIELQDRRMSEDSLRRDINDAIQTAARMSNPKRESGYTLGTAKSQNSMFTSNSYMDFENASFLKKTSDPSYGVKFANLKNSLRNRKRGGKWLRRMWSPFWACRRPVKSLQKWWRKRNTLPPTENGRKIFVDMSNIPKQVDERNNKSYCSNVVTSALYTPYDFFPRQVVVQFSKLANLYFLFVSILQMIPSWSATGNYTTIVPLMVFVLISMTREGVEDWNRSRHDKEENNREVLVAKIPSGNDQKSKEYNPQSADAIEFPPSIEYETRKWKDLKVGDIVRVLQNEWIPADLVILHSSGMRGQCFVETLALDGETTLKTREVAADVQKNFRVENIGTTSGICTVEDPNLDLFNFEGAFQFDNGEPTVPLGNGNVIYRGSALRNTASILGLVIFTGKETKMQLNASKNSRTKAPQLQSKVNRTVIVLAAFVLLLSGFSTLAAERIQTDRADHYWYLNGARVTRTQSMMGFIIMFNTLIPLSLYVSMEICKLIQRFHMQNDIDLYDPVNDVKCSVQTASLNEELGQVSYIFSDKTGTLTDNIMLFRKMSIAGFPWIHDLDLYFDNNEEGYLFHKVNQNLIDLNAEELQILQQVAKLPRKSFGGRISNAARTSTTNPILAQISRPTQQPRPSLSKASMARVSMARASMGDFDFANSKSKINISTNMSSLKMSGDVSGGDMRPSNVGGSSVHFAEQFDEDTSNESIRPKNSMSTFRPSNAAQNEGFFRNSLVSSTSNWQSTANPQKPQTTPSTLALLEYLNCYPHSAFTERAKFFLLSLALCHTASPDVDLNQTSNGDIEIEQIDYQAASPDELALVSAARDLGYMVIDRQLDSITLRTYPQGLENAPTDETYQILDTISFTSSRKRMSVIVKLPDERIYLLTKGADNVMIDRLKKSLLGLAEQKKSSIYHETMMRKSAEADLANEQRKYSFSNGRESLDSILRRTSTDLAIQESGRKSMQYGHLRHSTSTQFHNGHENMNLLSPHAQPHMRNSTQSSRSARSTTSTRSKQLNDEFTIENLSESKALERTLEQIDEFSTEGLRTLMYGHRLLSHSEYASWKEEYDNAKTAIVDRQKKVDEVGEKLEKDFSVTGATAIEDKLQKGVPEAIEKLRRANIHLWMLTGDKRETAVNIGYSCRLIKDYSTVITLSEEDNLEAKIMASLEEMNNNSIAHSVVVVDGQTLSKIEDDAILMSLFVDLGLRASSVILCRASPVQKANIVTSVRSREPKKTMLAIGDGANDIAMIQAANIGVGIAGREGLQAARSSDFSIGQFRFLLKLLLVHGRWNYLRTCEYILATFYKEFMFYMSQVIYQRNTMFTGTSLFESWSISMYNTLFTSLCVISLGTLTQDLSPTILIAVPELYQMGQANKGFSFGVMLKALVLAMLQCVMCNFLAYEFYGYDYGVKDNTIYPIGVVVYASVVCIVNFKIHFLTMMHYITAMSILSVLISCGGYMLWNVLIGLVYIIDPGKTYFVAREFWNQLGTELVFWATVFLCLVIGYLFELILQLFVNIFYPSDTFEYEELESDVYVMQRLEAESELELSQGWDYQDKLDHSWFAFFRNKWPGQPRATAKLNQEQPWRKRKRDYLAEKLRLKPAVDYDQEIQEILARRQREMDADIQTM